MNDLLSLFSSQQPTASQRDVRVVDNDLEEQLKRKRQQQYLEMLLRMHQNAQAGAYGRQMNGYPIPR